MRRIFINVISAVVFLVGTPIVLLMMFYMMIPIDRGLGIGTWPVYGSIVFTVMVLTMISPLLLFVGRDKMVFLGIPWVMVVRKKRVQRVVVNNNGFYFLFKNPRDCPFMYRWKDKNRMVEYNGYRMVAFYNIKATLALIRFFGYSSPNLYLEINWDLLPKKDGKYLLKKIGEMEAERDARL